MAIPVADQQINQAGPQERIGIDDHGGATGEVVEDLASADDLGGTEGAALGCSGGKLLDRAEQPCKLLPKLTEARIVGHDDEPR